MLKNVEVYILWKQICKNQKLEKQQEMYKQNYDPFSRAGNNDSSLKSQTLYLAKYTPLDKSLLTSA